MTKREFIMQRLPAWWSAPSKESFIITLDGDTNTGLAFELGVAWGAAIPEIGAELDELEPNDTEPPEAA